MDIVEILVSLELSKSRIFFQIVVCNFLSILGQDVLKGRIDGYRRNFCFSSILFFFRS